MFGASSPLPLSIELVALDTARNIRRRYTIEMTTDLFDVVIVELRWGRIGARGQSKRLSFNDRAAAERHVARTLWRRATAVTRIGVPYAATMSGEYPPFFVRAKSEFTTQAP